MRLIVCSVFDKAVGAYLQPYFARSKGEAIRSFSDACGDPQHQFNKHSIDYMLVELGYWDDSSGVFQCHEPVRILGAHEVLANRDAPIDPPPAGNGSFAGMRIES